MKKTNHESGSILLAVLLIVMVAVAVVGAAYMATTGQIRLTSRSADMDSLETTGEGVLDYAFGKWKDAMDSNGLMTATDANALVSGSNRPAVPARMQIVSLSITPVDANGVNSTDAVKTYDYKMSFVYTYVASVTLQTSGVGGLRTMTLRRNLVYTSVPPTRGMFFSEGDFELYKPAKMVIGGDVHTNASAHISTGTSSSNLTFLANSKVTYVGSYDNGIPAGGTAWSNSGTNYPPTYETSLASQVKKVPDIAGIGLGTAAEYNTTDSNPNNDGNRELIEPPVAGYPDPDSIAASRIYNNTGILINVSGPVDQTATLNVTNGAYTGGNISIKAQNGTTLTSAQATAIRNAVTNSVTTQVQTWVPNMVWVTSGHYTGSGSHKTWVDTSSWVDQGHYVTSNVVTQKTIYDKREVASVPITDLNLGSIVPTLNAATGFNGIVYMYDSGSSDQKAIRVTNGGVLPNAGLTIATEDGLYVQGDYNTGTTTNPNAVPSNASPAANASTTVSGYTTKSAALVGDSIMVLSNSWSDSNASSSVGSRNASNTTLNTALIGGYIQSTNGGSNGRSGYSGGMNNFPRFLESWSGDNMTFSGAFVSLYKSKQFTGSWDTGDIYVPPTRYWYFDTLLLSRVLPGIPATGGFVRGPLSRM
ncbi:MAG: hypothetical protein ABJF10_04690 [Chthoniobacter sp.]|uniref:hypothetical protein n=1 Tax=Chthoniobacter sp. TaxID=2510640 RepID=UPI0032A8739B